MNKLTAFEREVMEKLLDGEDPGLSILRQQLKEATVSSRELTGVGFYTTFRLPKSVKRLADGPSFKFGDVTASMQGLNLGAGFLLYVHDGALHMLEGYTYDEPWPGGIPSFELSYIHGNRRDLEQVRKAFYGSGSAELAPKCES